jgi:hypothetical protein
LRDSNLWHPAPGAGHSASGCDKVRARSAAGCRWARCGPTRAFAIGLCRRQLYKHCVALPAVSPLTYACAKASCHRFFTVDIALSCLTSVQASHDKRYERDADHPRAGLDSGGDSLLCCLRKLALAASASDDSLALFPLGPIFPSARSGYATERHDRIRAAPMWRNLLRALNDDPLAFSATLAVHTIVVATLIFLAVVRP